MAYSQQRLDSQQLFAYSKLGQEVALNIAVNFADTKHNQFNVGTDWSDTTQRLAKHMTDLLQLQQHLNNGIKASVKTEAKISQLVTEAENSDENNITNINISEIFDENMADIVAKDETKVEDNDNYKKLLEVFKEFGSEAEENDDELMTLDTESDRIPIDPISKKEIENPVKNKTCGHIYDGEQLRLLLETKGPNGKIRCPLVGCNNRSVTLADVVVDHKTRALIQKLKRNQ